MQYRTIYPTPYFSTDGRNEATARCPVPSFVCLCVCECVRSISYFLHRQRTVASQITAVLVYPLSRHAFETFPTMKRATGLSKIHVSAMNIRTYPLFNKGCLTMQSLGIITMYYGQPLRPSSSLLSKVAANTAHQQSYRCPTACTDRRIQQFDLL
jgi:hypothetical protein